MDILSGRTLLRPTNPTRSQAFYRDTLGLAIYREFGPPEAPSLVFFYGNGMLEVTGHATPPGQGTNAMVSLWLQVRDVEAEYQRLRDLGVTMLREPRTEPWGLIEAWIADPDGIQIVLVQIPADHPLRRDQRPIETLQ
ncbi:MAG TPA: VOC family protein [Enteractinococcus helveticum]|uniref:VOC family protein n=1 Tax=Enteractinococcus helveticum TaxID=1837282 RepID=A0A921FLL4_9MICC|nr:VOC family protein [Enteractinococcus helveticum]HJF13542.1 VOC family protein [Enteractinococcus helveticum]